MRDKPSLNRNINSAPLHLYDKFSLEVLACFTWLVYLFHFKFHYKTLNKKLFTSIKHDLVIGRDMSCVVKKF